MSAGATASAMPTEVRRSDSEIDFGGRLIHIDGDEVRPIDLGPGRLSGEWVMVPRNADAAEDDGWLLSFVYDRAADRSELVILAADDPAAGAVASVKLPVRVPDGVPRQLGARLIVRARLASKLLTSPYRVSRRAAPLQRFGASPTWPRDELTTCRRRRTGMTGGAGGTFLGRALPPSFVRTVVVIEAGAEHPYRAADWTDAIVAVEQGELWLDGVQGGHVLVRRGDVLWLAPTPPAGPAQCRRGAGRARRHRAQPIRPESGGADYSGRMFGLMRKKLSGSYCFLIARSRAVFAPYAFRASASADSSAWPVKLVYVLPFP